MYYQLLTRQSKSAKWELEFGDSDKECVEFERDVLTNEKGLSKSNTKLLSFKRVPTQKQIVSTVATLNNKATS